MVVTGSQIELFAIQEWFSCLCFIEAPFFSGRGGYSRGLVAQSLAGKCADSWQEFASLRCALPGVSYSSEMAGLMDDFNA